MQHKKLYTLLSYFELLWDNEFKVRLDRNYVLNINAKTHTDITQNPQKVP